MQLTKSWPFIFLYGDELVIEQKGKATIKLNLKTLQVERI